ncbi:hypothetical protein [Leptospira sarikeiensis]|uniref:Uncharacterized protein n=1 Tax=Leptospira sarikeiensis TaxID=2484943 RepID=A0A4R9K0R0_9LEPT|nr:hypothetical protein [Leptospira sarikeiensis]TGL59249.1 hypothetical protein EHQ64_16320 [Leptospira sarikeiensis]
MNPLDPISRGKLILGIDCAAFIGGITVIVLHKPIAEFYNLPQRLLLFMGIVNLLYGSYSGSLFFGMLFGKSVKKLWINILIFGNLGWSFVCLGMIVSHWNLINIYGISHIGSEGVYVIALGILEFRFVRPLGV